VVRIQPVWPQRDKGTERVFLDDGVDVLRILDEEMGRDVHRMGLNGEKAEETILPFNWLY
jgi:hypothetical protein